VLHQLELSNKHVTTQYGLNAAMSCVHSWLHGGDPVEDLQFDRWVTMVRPVLSESAVLFSSDKLTQSAAAGAVGGGRFLRASDSQPSAEQCAPRGGNAATGSRVQRQGTVLAAPLPRTINSKR
jgi:hypothetical protein